MHARLACSGRRVVVSERQGAEDILRCERGTLTGGDQVNHLGADRKTKLRIAAVLAEDRECEDERPDYLVRGRQQANIQKYLL